MTAADQIYQNVLSAVQDAEEISGSEGDEYVALMDKIAHEVAARKKAYLERVADVARKEARARERACVVVLVTESAPMRALSEATRIAMSNDKMATLFHAKYSIKDVVLYRVTGIVSEYERFAEYGEVVVAPFAYGDALALYRLVYEIMHGKGKGSGVDHSLRTALAHLRSAISDVLASNMMFSADGELVRNGGV